jgi:hypothetical protein
MPPVTRRPPALLLALLLAAAALLVAGCGGDGGGGSDNGIADKTADEIVDEALAAGKAAQSVYVHGGTTTGDDPLELDMHVVAGVGGEGELTANGLTFEIVRVGDEAYFKGDADFWSQFGGAAAATLFDDRWVKAPADSGDLASLTPLTDLEQLLDGILGEHGNLEKGEETEVNGISAIAVRDTEQDGTLYVATEGEPYPLRLEASGEAEGTIDFEDWDEDYEVEAPEDAVDITELQGG